MTEFQKAAQHRIFPARRRGDTLVVTPAGSLAGYGVGEANREQARLAALLADPQIENLVIDLHHADYFGTEMVGVFVRLQQACRGATGLVRVAPGMRKVLEVMRLEDFFSFYRSERQAIRAISRIPLHERFKPRFGLPTGAVVTVTTCLLVTATCIGSISKLTYQVIGSPMARDYCTLNQLWADFRQSEQSPSSFEEGVARRSDLNRSLERLNTRVAMHSHLELC